MARRKLIVRRALAIAALLAGLVGCARASSEKTVVRFWGLGREGEVVGTLIAAFERENPDIHVELQQLPFLSAHEKLLTAYVGDSTPDVSQVGNTWVPELAALGALAALGPRVAASTGIQQADYFDGIWATNVVEGELYGIPWYVDTRLLFYRRDILADAGFTAPPQSWDEWRRAMVAVKAKVGPDRYAALLPLNEYDQLLALALQQDEPVLRDHDTYGNFRSAGFRSALSFYIEIFRAGLAPVVTHTQVANPWNELGRGYVSFMVSGPWSIGELKRRLPKEQQPGWMTMAMPGPKGPGASTAGGSSLVIFAAARHKDAAWKLIEFLSRPASQREFYGLSGNLPSRRTSWEDPRFANDEYVLAFRDQLERARQQPPVPEWERIMTEMRIVSERAVHDAIGRPAEAVPAIVDAAVTELDARVDRLLKKRRWILAQKGGSR